MMEIGGYFELEHLNSRPYYSGLCELNLGRTALVYLLGIAAMQDSARALPYL